MVSRDDVGERGPRPCEQELTAIGAVVDMHVDVRGKRGGIDPFSGSASCEPAGPAPCRSIFTQPVAHSTCPSASSPAAAWRKRTALVAAASVAMSLCVGLLPGPSAPGAAWAATRIMMKWGGGHVHRDRQPVSLVGIFAEHAGALLA